MGCKASGAHPKKWEGDGDSGETRDSRGIADGRTLAPEWTVYDNCRDCNQHALANRQFQKEKNLRVSKTDDNSNKETEVQEAGDDDVMPDPLWDDIDDIEIETVIKWKP